MNGNVFGIGMFKTGTKSLGVALNLLGYHGIYKPWFILKDAQGHGDSWYSNPELWYKHYDSIRNRIEHFNAFSDAPWIFLYKQLDEWYPESKFILTLRESSLALAKSDICQWKGKPNIPSIQTFIDRYEKHNKMVREYFKDKKNLLEICFEKGDGWEKLCAFLEKPIPQSKFPHVNKGGYRK